jgi:ribosomal-protein-alanine N-acetyltransferase
MLETERLLFRTWQPEDWLAFRPIATDPEVMQYIETGKPWSDERIKQFVDRQISVLGEYGFCLWQLIHKQDRRLIGFCGMQPLGDTGEIEIGWWLAKDYWKRGLATEAGRAVLDYAFATRHLPRVVAIVQPPNLASRRVMEKLGMHFEKEMIYKGPVVLLYVIHNPAQPVREEGEIVSSLDAARLSMR